jgi:hypothetical protein
MAKVKVIRAYARHKKCGHIMEPFDAGHAEKHTAK